MLRDATFHLILFRLHFPVELRSIICNDYFPFLPNEIERLQARKLFSMNYIKIFTLFESPVDPNSDTKDPCYIVLWIIKRPIEGTFEVTIRKSCPVASVSDCRYVTDYLHCKREEDNFFVLNADINITEENMHTIHESIVKWYRNRILYVFDDARNVGILKN